MKKVVRLAVALALPLLFISVSNQVQAQTTSCEEQLSALIETTKHLCSCDPRKTDKTRDKLLKKLYDAQKELMKGTVKDQYKAAKKVWEYDYELRKLYFKNDVACTDGSVLDESALQLLMCIVDLYYPNSGYDPYSNGVVACD